MLNASQNNQTRLYLVNAQEQTTRLPEAPILGNDNEVSVYLEIPNLVNAQDYCATYDPNPNGTEPMTMQPCTFDSTTADATNDTDPHSSQIFQYNRRSGQIRPTWFQGSDDGTGGTNATAAAQGGFPQRPGAPSPQGPQGPQRPQVPQGPQGPQGPQPGPGSQNPSPNPNPNARNVTLVFVPAGIFGADDVTEDSTSSVVTATTTTTVTVYASATGSVGASSDSSTATSTSSSVLPSASGMNVEAVGGVPIVGGAVPSPPVPVPVPVGGARGSPASASCW